MAGGPPLTANADRLTPEKDARAFARPERRLLAAGGGFFRRAPGGQREVTALTGANPERTRLAGGLSGPALPRQYAKTDLVVLLSKTRAFGRAALELMAPGMPAAVTSQGGAKYPAGASQPRRVASGDEEFNQAIVRRVRDHVA